jgi:hypothetical protein
MVDKWRTSDGQVMDKAPAAVRAVRTVLTAVIALSVGVALISWLKAGTEDAGPAFQERAPTGAAVPSRAPWAHRNDPAQSARVGVWPR